MASGQSHPLTKASPLDNFINDWFFSIPSVALHTIWFVLWFCWRLDVSLLTNIVSLEAIYLSLFIGVAQKHQHEATRAHLTKEK